MALRHPKDRPARAPTTSASHPVPPGGGGRFRAIGSRRASFPDVAYQIIHDELMIDGNARLNWRPSSPPGWSRRPRRSCPSASTRT